VDPGGICRQSECASLLQVLLKLTITYGKGGTSDSHPIVSEWERHGWFPGQVSVAPEPERGQSKMQY
jgi:hypothetical protein